MLAKYEFRETAASVSLIPYMLGEATQINTFASQPGFVQGKLILSLTLMLNNFMYSGACRIFTFRLL